VGSRGSLAARHTCGRVHAREVHHQRSFCRESGSNVKGHGVWCQLRTVQSVVLSSCDAAQCAARGRARGGCKHDDADEMRWVPQHSRHRPCAGAKRGERAHRGGLRGRHTAPQTLTLPPGVCAGAGAVRLGEQQTHHGIDCTQPPPKPATVLQHTADNGCCNQHCGRQNQHCGRQNQAASPRDHAASSKPAPTAARTRGLAG
jgi:hypothetical protein